MSKHLIMNELRIVEATTKDAVALSLLSQMTFMENYANMFDSCKDLWAYCNEHFSIEKTTEAIENRDNFFFIAYLEDNPVGYAKLILNSFNRLMDKEELAKLERIYVLKKFIAMRIGHKLKEEVFKTLEEKQQSKIWLHVCPTNFKAINFYEKSGFSVLGKEPFVLGNKEYEAITMTKSLEYEKV